MSRPGESQGVRKPRGCVCGGGTTAGPDLHPLPCLRRLNRSDHGLFHTRTSLLKLSTKVQKMWA